MTKEEFYQLIENRRSIRKYKPDPIPKQTIERIIHAGLNAPSGKNRQNWRFIIIQGKKRDDYLKYSQKSWSNIKDLLKMRLKPSLYEFTERFFFTLGDAPVVIFCYSINSPDEKYLTSIGSVYMAAENINLAALAEGLGSCTMGAPLEIQNEVNEFLGTTQWPEFKVGEMELLCAITLGVPDHQPPKATRQIEGRITWLD
jgi:nitroreductase